jgi:hypothetical protein
MGAVRRLVALALIAAALVACEPVIPHVQYQHGTFEGFPTISYVPAAPVGIVYLFHGSHGSAAFAEKVETVAVLNWFTDRGWGFVSTESTERTGDKRWEVANPSLTNNPDLARLTRLQQHLIDTTAMSSTTPLAGIGMSNGSRFVTLWGQTWRDAGYPVAAIWAANGQVAAPVRAAGGLTVPTAFVISENDSIVPNAVIRNDFSQAEARGTPALLFEVQERPLSALRFLRIPGVDNAEANAVFGAFVATGAWDATGTRVAPTVPAAVNLALGATLPSSLTATQRSEVANEVALRLAEHQFSSQFVGPIGAFVTAQLPTP